MSTLTLEKAKSILQKYDIECEKLEEILLGCQADEIIKATGLTVFVVNSGSGCTPFSICTGCIGTTTAI